MEAYNAGWLSILPPVIAIVLALVTKEVFFSLMLGVLSGTFIYAVGTGAENVVMSTVEVAFETMTKKVDFNIIIFCSLLGALVYVVFLAGGSRAYGRWASKRIKTKRAALLSTSGLGITIFIDDYFNCLTIGTVMTPVTDTLKVSRAKLAYIIDATAAPVCIIAPVSSWAAAVGSSLASTGAFESDFGAFVSTIPYNFYALLSIIMVFAVCCFNIDFGPMARSEAKAEQGNLGNVGNSAQAQAEVSQKGTIAEMVVPILALVVFACLGFLYNGGYWGNDPKYHTIAAALGNCTASKGLVWASFGALTVAFIQFVPRGVLSLKAFMDGCMQGMKAMMPANTILVLAWAISGVCRDLLQTPVFVKSLVEADGGLTGGLLPAVIFILACFLSFSTGTAWGTFGILIPIVVPVAQVIDPNGSLVLISLSATLAGSVFGDHCSPISDTTILSSAGAACTHIEHVSTQMPYACVVAVSSLVGYIVAGFSQSLPVSFGAGLVVMVLTLLYFRSRVRSREAAA